MLFNAMSLCDEELDELSSSILLNNLRDSSFQDTIIKVLFLEKSFLNLILKIMDYM
jgi:hypothetical protein